MRETSFQLVLRYLTALSEDGQATYTIEEHFVATLEAAKKELAERVRPHR
jgi:hypothetical protein